MAIVVQEEGPVPIPEEMAHEFGIHKGSEVEWERTEDGALKLRTHRTRAQVAWSLLGAGRGNLQPGESGVEAFLKWRQEERELESTYYQW